MTEIWKDIPGFESWYMASTEGRIKSLMRHNPRLGYYKSERILKAGGSGYPHVNLRGKTMTIHRLVAKTFLGIPEGLIVNHTNGDKKDSRLINLECITQSENVKHGFDVLGRISSAKGRFGKKNPMSKPVLQIKDGIIVKRWESLGMAESAIGAQVGAGLYGTGFLAGYYWLHESDYLKDKSLIYKSLFKPKSGKKRLEVENALTALTFPRSSINHSEFGRRYNVSGVTIGKLRASAFSKRLKA